MRERKTNSRLQDNLISIKEKLLQVFKKHAIFYGDFTLSSGLKSSYYFDGRMFTLWPEGAYLVGKAVFEILKDTPVEAVGGLTLGADPIVTAVALVSYLKGKPLPAFIVREELKRHGTQKQIEGNLPENSKVAVVDDVVTTGTSIFKAIEVVERRNCKVVKVVALLDRHQGGSEELKQRGYDFVAILSADAEGSMRIAQS
jgi:orotate phosphoribosyltransferase